jgi:hypothetical protein
MTAMRSRGQTLPLWTVATLASLVLMYFAINYGNVLRWQIRAQNNADSAAAALASLQADSWNETIALLYATDIEEFRARKLLDSLINISKNSGGCVASPDASSNGCLHAWDTLEPLFQASVSRYTADLMALQGVTQQASFSNLYETYAACGNTNCSDATKLLAALNSATNCQAHSVASPNFLPTNGDCSFVYSVVNAKKRAGLLSASEDAFHTGTPDGGYVYTLNPLCTSQNFPISQMPATCTNAALAPTTAGQTPWYVGTPGSYYFNDELFSPVEVEVAVCSVVPPIIPNFAGLKTPPYFAVARSAATNVMVEQDWLQPAEFTRGYNPNLTYQPMEPYAYIINNAGGFYNANLASYNLNFGGLTYWDTNGANHAWSTDSVTQNDFETLVGWWAPIPVAPFTGSVAQSTLYTTSPAACVGQRS